MTDQEISKLAYKGKRPESALTYEWLLWYRLRDLYDDVRAGRTSEADGKQLKTDYVNSFISERDGWERLVKLWQRIEQASIAYAKSDEKTPAGDALYQAVYRK